MSAVASDEVQPGPTQILKEDLMQAAQPTHHESQPSQPVGVSETPYSSTVATLSPSAPAPTPVPTPAPTEAAPVSKTTESSLTPIPPLPTTIAAVPAPPVTEVAVPKPPANTLKSVSNLFLPAKYKVVFLGDMSVGKTSIIARFMYNTFDKQEHTIGIDFLSKTLQVEDRTLRLQLWDTAGQERYRSLISGYIRESQAAVIVYDTTSRASFDSVEKWVDDVRKHCGPDVVIVMTGNKSDLTSKRTVTKDEGEAKAQHTSCLFIETSAKTGAGIQNLFTKMAMALPTEAASSPLAAPGPAPPPAMHRDPTSGPFSLTAVTSTNGQASGGWCKC
eukprot:GGOE01043269.1.p1 GENE.GGOE01043269.1~~GGOE01043269.1.p1  ORF type:complete len:332 (+),score=46.47 GGOE01043269.1:51-1046(+)